MIKHREAADGSGSGRAIVLQACRSMLRPIARLLIRSGIVHRDFATLMREVYVEVARSEFGLRGRPTSISRTALLTGLARKEVRRISNLLEDEEYATAVPSAQDRITRVLTGWYQDPDYVDDDGRPLALPAEGETPSFADLKSRYGGDVPASAMLRELIAAGTVTRDGDQLRPTRRYFMPSPSSPEHLLRAGSVLEDIGTTVVHNLSQLEAERWFERRVVNTHIPDNKLAEFRAYLEDEGQGFLERVDAWLSAHETGADGKKVKRVGLGLYTIRRDDD